MDEQLILKNKLKEIRAEKSLSQSELAEMVGKENKVVAICYDFFLAKNKKVV